MTADPSAAATAGPVTRHYLIIDEYTRPGNPAGVLRRTEREGTTTETVFRRNLKWADLNPGQTLTAAGDTDHELIEIPAREADRIITAMKHDAASADDPHPGHDDASGKPTVRQLGIDPDAQQWARSGDGPGSLETAFPLPSDNRAGAWERGDWVLLRVHGDPDRRVLVFDRHEWNCFLHGARNGEFDAAAATE